MTRLIDADAIKIIKVKTKVNGKTVFAEMMQKVLDTAPTVDAEPVRHGKWIYNKSDRSIKCSECRVSMPYKFFPYRGFTDWYSNYCPNCGAYMRAEPRERGK